MKKVEAQQAFSYQIKALAGMEVVDSVLLSCDETAGEHVVVPEGVKQFGTRAFSYNNKTVKTIEIPNGVTVIGEAAFVVCDNLVKVNISDNVTSIGYVAFDSCINLAEVKYLMRGFYCGTGVVFRSCCR